MLPRISLPVALLVFPFLFAFPFPLTDTAAPVKHVVDSWDPSISYVQPSDWEAPEDGMDIGGRHKLTSHASAYALFSFTGVSFTFVSTKWPYHVTTDISIDGETPVTLDLQDYSTPSPPSGGGGGSVPANTIKEFQGLQNGPHTVRISVHPGDSYAVVGRFIYTTFGPGTGPSAPSPPHSTLSTSALPNATLSNSIPPRFTPSSSNKPKHNKSNSNLSIDFKKVIRMIVIGVGIVGGLLL